MPLSTPGAQHTGARHLPLGLPPLPPSWIPGRPCQRAFPASTLVAPPPTATTAPSPGTPARSGRAHRTTAAPGSTARMRPRRRLPPQDYHNNHASSVAGTLHPGGWPNTAPPPVPPVVHLDMQGQGGSGASTPPSVATTTVSSSTGTRLPSAGSFPLPPISEATASSPSPTGFTASDIVRLVADSVAAATASPARVPRCI